MPRHREHIERVLRELRRHGASDIGVEYGGKHPRVNFTHDGMRQFHVVAFSPSDHRAWLNSLSQLRHQLGVVKREDPREKPAAAIDEAPVRTEEFLQGYARGVEEGAGRHRKQHAQEVAALQTKLRGFLALVDREPAPLPPQPLRPALIASNGDLTLVTTEDDCRAALYLMACSMLWRQNPNAADDLINLFFGEETDDELRGQDQQLPAGRDGAHVAPQARGAR